MAKTKTLVVALVLVVFATTASSSSSTHDAQHFLNTLWRSISSQPAQQPPPTPRPSGDTSAHPTPIPTTPPTTTTTPTTTPTPLANQTTARTGGQDEQVDAQQFGSLGDAVDRGVGTVNQQLDNAGAALGPPVVTGAVNTVGEAGPLCSVLASSSHVFLQHARIQIPLAARAMAILVGVNTGTAATKNRKAPA